MNLKMNFFFFGRVVFGLVWFGFFPSEQPQLCQKEDKALVPLIPFFFLAKKVGVKYDPFTLFLNFFHM